MTDAYHWLGHEEAEALGGAVAQIQQDRRADSSTSSRKSK